MFFMKPVKIEASYAPKTYRIVEALINHLINKEILEDATAKNIVDRGRKFG